MTSYSTAQLSTGLGIKTFSKYLGIALLVLNYIYLQS